jgi:hypothetical protein
LGARARLAPGESLRYGNNGMIKSVTRLTMQTNGRLVLTKGRQRVWASPDGPRNSYLELTRHGDLILFSPTHRRVWHTHTGGHRGGYLLVCKGGFRLYGLGYTPTFTAGTPELC